MRVVRSGERLFPPIDGPPEATEERLVENFEAAIKHAFGARQENGWPEFARSSVIRTESARYANAPVTSGRANSDRIVFFAPGPVTEADLQRESLRLSAAIRHHQRCRKRVRWLSENAGTIALIAFLLVLAWFVTVR